MQDMVNGADTLEPPSEGREGDPKPPLYAMPVSFWEEATIPVEGGVPCNVMRTGLGDDAMANAERGDEPTEDSLRYMPVPMDE